MASEWATEKAKRLMDKLFINEATSNSFIPHLASALDAAREEGAREQRRLSAEAIRKEGKPHTMASENADVYAEYQRVCERCADLVEALPLPGADTTKGG